jgi:hypothetical protein
MARSDVGAVDDGDARFVQIAAHASVRSVPRPSKRTSLRGFVLLTYSAPSDGLTTMLKSTVPTCAKAADSPADWRARRYGKTSRSGRSKRTALVQLRPSSILPEPLARVASHDQAHFRTPGAAC